MTDQAQLSEADVKRLYAQRKFALIEEHRLAGRLDDLLTGKTEEDDK